MARKGSVKEWIGFALVAPLLHLVAWMPFWLLRPLSLGLYVLIYKILGYRKTVVMENLTNSFPERDAAEIIELTKSFYRYFSMLILEIVKTIHVSESELKERVVMENVELLQKHYENNQSVILAAGHHANWELCGARYGPMLYHQLYVIYHPLRNPYFNRLINRARTRLGNDLYPMGQAFREMIKNSEEITITAFIADQTPSPKDAYWCNFLHQDTPFFTGMARYATKFNYPIIYSHIRRDAKGRYTIRLEELSAEPEKESMETLMEKYIRALEQDIREQPETWLWTHRRWKHKRKQD